MASITKNHFEILLHPSLRTKWLALDFTNLQTILTKYFNEEIVNEICHAAIIDKKDAVDKLHRRVIQSDNEDLYMDIVNLCKEKCQCILAFIDVMSIIWDNYDENEDESISPTKRQRKQTTFDLNEKLNFCLNKNAIANLLQKYSDGNERERDAALFDNLLKYNKEFHNEVLMLLKEENDKYQDCHKFMEHVELLNNENVSPSCGSSTNKDVESLRKFQLEMSELKEKINNLTSEMEAKMNTYAENCNAKTERMRNQSKGDFSLVLFTEIAPSTSSLQVTLAIDYSIGCPISYSEYKVPASLRLLDLKRTICANSSQFMHLSTQDIKLIHLKTLLVGENKTLHELGLVEHPSIKCMINYKSGSYITVFVQDEDNKREELHVSKCDTVLWLKAEYSERTGRLLEDIKLFYKGKEMYSNESMIVFYGVENDSILSLS